MKVHTVLAVYDGILTDVEVHARRREASQRGFELAKQYGLVAKEEDSGKLAGDVGPELGSAGLWRHHWSDSQREVIVAECEVT